ncbi:MAG TPA: hypothetical protein ENO06_02815 [Methanolinea sp.]|nr:hypothetical protein [Methanolinea sp.]
MILVLFVTISAIPLTSSAVIDEHILGRAVGSAHQVEPTLELVRDDMVASKVLLSDTKGDDRLEWTFTGPRGRIFSDSQILSAGQNWAQSELDLSLIPSGDVVGTWTLDLSLNGMPEERETFTVEPLTGLVWWGPFVGMGVFLVVVLVAGSLVVGGLVFLKRALQKKKRENQE